MKSKNKCNMWVIKNKNDKSYWVVSPFKLIFSILVPFGCVTSAGFVDSQSAQYDLLGE